MMTCFIYETRSCGVEWTRATPYLLLSFPSPPLSIYLSISPTLHPLGLSLSLALPPSSVCPPLSLSRLFFFLTSFYWQSTSKSNKLIGVIIMYDVTNAKSLEWAEDHTDLVRNDLFSHIFLLHSGTLHKQLSFFLHCRHLSRGRLCLTMVSTGSLLHWSGTSVMSAAGSDK